MRTTNLETDVYMTTEHKRAKKTKVSFAATMNKVLVGTLIFATVLGGTSASAQAASKDTTLDLKLNITENYEQSAESCTYNIRYVLSQIQTMQREGIVTNAILIELATELNTLSQVFSVSGESSSDEVQALVKEVDSTLKAVEQTDKNSDGLTKAKAAISAFNSLNGKGTIATAVKEENNSTLLATKANYPSKFSDVAKDSKYYTAVSKLAKLGAIGGTSSGKFNTTAKITNADFLGILMRAADKDLARATKGSDYSTAIIKAAIKDGIVTSSDLKAEDYKKPISRQKMALYVSRVLDKVLKEDTEVIYGIERLIPDYSKVEGTKYENAIKTVYSEGIIVGSKDYTFNPTSAVTRGDAVNVILKVVSKTYRTDMSKVKIPVQSVEKREVMTLKWSDKNRPLPIPGDTFIDENGKKTVLKGIKVNGYTIVGYGQNIQDLYGNMVTAKGVIKNGASGDVWNDDYTYLGSTYLIDKKTGVGYFQKDWILISEYESKLASKVVNPKANQRVGFWTVYNAEAFGGSWEWDGPR